MDLIERIEAMLLRVWGTSLLLIRMISMKKHLSTRLAVILLGVTACVILLSILFNTVFLKKFYINSKADKMMGYYEMINKSFENNTIYRNEDVLPFFLLPALSLHLARF